MTLYQSDKRDLERLAAKVDYFVEQMTTEHKWSTEFAIRLAESVFKGAGS